MANHGAGNKFVSINLNKSYGKISGPANSSSYGASRARSGIQAGGGGGMVVLSRPRSSQKTGQKLSVPSPINLPSMRKEHEKFDLSGAGSGSAGGAGGSSSRPSSAGMGWTKPAALILQEKGNEIPSDFVGGTLSNADAAGRGGGVYVPPARSGSATNKTVPAYRGAPTPVEKVAILRGEDFPSLHTSLSTESGHTNKLKDVANKKTKQLPGEHLSNNRTDDNNIGDTRTDIQGNISQQNSGFGSSGNDVSRQHLSGPSSTEDSQKQVSYYNGSLPEVRLNPRYDWADDERDTGHVITDISRNQITQKNKEYWERDFDMPRGMPPKPAPYAFNKWGQRGGETGKILSSEMFKADPYNGDARPTTKEGRDRDSWNNSASSDRFVAPLSNVRGRAHSVSDLGSSDRKNMSSDEGGRQPWNNSVDPAGNKGGDRIVRDQFRGEQIQRYNSNNYQNASQAKSTSYVGGKGLLENDPVLNFSKVKKLPSKSEELYLEDPFATNWSGELMGVVKRKKDVPELAEFHDPARESFEAELERVQQMQERERKRAIEEQQRAMEVARRQEDERLKLAREQEERQMRLEEEAREAAWRAEQEQQEANQKTNELRIAREEEKQRMQMEEERRKQGAMQKLLELEEKIARREAEATKENTAHAVDEISGPEKEIEASRAADISGWEDSERMVESITASALCDSSGLNKFVESGFRSRSFADTSVLTVRGKSVKSWRRDSYEIEGSSNFILHNQDNAQRSPGRDTFFPAKNFSPRKDVHGGSGLVYPQNYASAGVLDHNVNDPFHLRRQSWNLPGERDHYDSNPGMDLEAHVDADWGGSSAHHHAHSIYPERSYQNPKLGEVGSYSRSRYSIRQPRVLPPPTLSSMNRPLKREDRMADNNYLRDHSMERRFDDVRQEQLEDPEMGTFQPTHTATRDQLLEGNHSIRCDSQSSLSVTSPPSAPTHLSHEDSRSTPDSSAAADIKAARPSSSDPVVQNGSFFNAADDGDWIVETHENLQVQEVYDEGGEYQEVDEVHTEDEDIDLNEEFEALNLENKDSPQASENLILGFNEGIEVEMPSEESDGNQKESRFTLPQFFNNADPMLNDGQVRPRSSTEVQKTEELTVGSAVESNGTPPMFLGRAEAAVISGQPLPISAAPSPVSQIATSTMPAAPNRPDVPVQLQLGLFSGQSLIQAPVPAIQIGSIQMPLHLHPPMGSSLPHQSTPIFQFGQLRYNTPVLQGITPLVPQTVSFVQPTMPGMYASLNPAGPVPDQPVQQSSQSQITNKEEALATNSGYFCETNRSLNMDLNSLQGQVEEDKNVVIRGPSSNSSKIENDRVGSEVNLDGRLQYPSSPGDRKSSTGGGQLSSRVISPLQFSSERVTIRSKAPGSLSGGRGKGRESYSNAKSFGPKSSTFVSTAPRMESSRSYRKLQRRDEHQIPENADRRLLHNDERMNFGPRGSRMSSRNGSRRGNSKLAKHTTESDWPVSGPASTNDITIGSKAVKEIPDKSLIIGEFISRSGEGRLKRNVEEDIEVPLQSRFVRVYEQPGIEIPSDEDDFIEVRSKRQMLNDRREQREKENKAKSRLAKNSQKPRPSSQNTTAPRNNNKILRSFGKGLLDEGQPNFIAPEVNGEPSARFDAITVSHPLAPIGTPSHSDGHCETMSRAVMPGQVSGLPVESSGGKNVEPGVAYETKSNVTENIEGSLSNWNNTWVMPLTQNQLEDAMNPVQEKPSGSIGGPVLSSSSLMKDKLSSSASPINSLLAGKKIQFGAVTSPTILPQSSHIASQGIGSGRSEQVSHGLSASENMCSLFDEEKKHPKETSSHVKVSESKAEASAVAVAAISTNNIQETRAGHSVSASGSEHAADDGTDNDQKFMSQSRTEDSLSVSLPADLSVEASPISPWQPLQSPQIASNHMLSHFPGGHPSHFPFYEMNPMVGGPFFAFGPHEDASGTQKNSTAMSSPIGPWQQPHAGTDSFYGRHAGFASPFISQTGGFTGGQGHPHMVVYNHFAPVGQVGLSFMGTTYIPSGKQPNWKHDNVSSAMSVNEGTGLISGQNVPHSASAPIQHLAPGPALVPMTPPLAMFDVSSYHQSSDMSGPARWSHPPPPHLQPMPPLLPLRPESLMHSQLINGPPPDKPMALTHAPVNRFPDSQNSASNYPVISRGPVSQFPAELGIVEPSSRCTPIDNAVSKTSDTAPDGCKIGESSQIGSSSSKNTKNWSHDQQHHSRHSAGYKSQRGGGGSTQRNGNHHQQQQRGTGYHSRNQPGKVKQMYVPKQPAASLT